MSDDYGNRWRAAARAAAFVPYEPVGDTIDGIWPSGFGGPPEATGHLAMDARRDGADLSVDTIATPSHGDPNVRRSMLVHDLLGRRVLDQSKIELPYSITVESDDRDISVSGRPTTFTGVRTAGSSRWIGEATVDGLLIRIELDGAVDFELRPCTDPNALAPGPPGQMVSDTE
ncbi:hypothetical protein [Ilumatobacter coccineus]|uniref:Uncharacterized protein n=1 Tax=Ilumatobacter coccineus (strain NBRC 103263 / KCTC 29153 / YM16-304) TaxID=1313172 RepID=A0A6C7E9Z5_ILUCY|nr:hypothetical protein [Ilumatobacter coccineus]BAN04494.1 hypothetical protein YM304_41800 [Ilumatobacter coccineus YM16-304]